MSIDIAIPYGGYWSTPFARWQGSFAHLHSLQFGAWVARKALEKRGIDAAAFDHGALGMTVPQRGSFYGLPWLMGQIGAASVAGPTINQACATGARVLQSCAAEIREGNAPHSLAIAADRTSNGPHICLSGAVRARRDRRGRELGTRQFRLRSVHRAVDGADGRERRPPRRCRHGEAARGHACGATSSTRMRSPKVRRSCAASWTFRSMCPTAASSARRATLDGDEGIHATTAEGLARLKPVIEGGTVTYGGQTHPADGSAAIVLTTPGRARELSREPGDRHPHPLVRPGAGRAWLHAGCAGPCREASAAGGRPRHRARSTRSRPTTRSC